VSLQSHRRSVRATGSGQAPHASVHGNGHWSGQVRSGAARGGEHCLQNSIALGCPYLTAAAVIKNFSPAIMLAPREGGSRMETQGQIEQSHREGPATATVRGGPHAALSASRADAQTTTRWRCASERTGHSGRACASPSPCRWWRGGFWQRRQRRPEAFAFLAALRRVQIGAVRGRVERALAHGFFLHSALRLVAELQGCSF
jgi:hypothetical protein